MKACSTVVLVALAISTGSYRIDYWDCSKPNAIMEYDLRTYCETTQQLLGLQKSRKYHVLQKKKKTEMEGWSCTSIRSTFILHCGMFSHQELIQMPDIEIKESIPQQKCRTMINTGYMTTKEGSTHEVKIGEETVFHVSERGILHEENNKIWCEGQELKINNNILSGILKMVQYRVTIQEESFIIDRERVEALSDHSILPRECLPQSGGCISGKKTYIWKAPKNECPLIKINTGNFDVSDEWLLEKKAKIIFRIEDRAKAPTGCPQGEILYTEYSELYLTETDGYEHTQEVVDFSLYARQLADYILYETERMSMTTSAISSRNLCQEQYRDTKMMTIKIDEDKFGRRAGEVLYTFTCTKKIGTLQAKGECYDRVPILTEEAEEMHVDTITGIATSHASRMPCNKFFPDKIHSHEGWISLPSLQKVKEPRKMIRQINGSRHEDMSQGGLYTKEELDQWESFLHYGHFKESIIERITTGTCINQECSNGETGNLQNYNLELLIANKFGIWEQTKAWITSSGAYLSAMVLIIYAVRLSLWSGLMFHTIYREGSEVAATVIYAMCCGSLYKWGKILRRRKKAFKIPSENEPQDELQTLA